MHGGCYFHDECIPSSGITYCPVEESPKSADSAHRAKFCGRYSLGFWAEYGIWNGSIVAALCTFLSVFFSSYFLTTHKYIIIIVIILVCSSFQSVYLLFCDGFSILMWINSWRLFLVQVLSARVRLGNCFIAIHM